MSTLNIRLPESLHKQTKLYAAWEGISLNQLIGTALAEKRSALAAEDNLAKRAGNGTREKFAAALQQVPDVEAELQDRR